MIQEEINMTEKQTLKRARMKRRQGKSPTTQAGEFVREEMHHIREGKHGARSTKQAIAIGLSKARRAGGHLRPPPKETASAAKGQRIGGGRHRPSPTRSRAIMRVLKREPQSAASHSALSRQAQSSAARRCRASRSAAAKKAARTNGSSGRSAPARKAARAHMQSR